MANKGYSPFTFLGNRKKSVPPNEGEIEGFDVFMTQKVLSMSGNWNISDYTNTLAFFNLPKRIQCLAYTSFDGNYIPVKWKLAKKAKTELTEENITYIMGKYHVSRNDAISCIAFGIGLDE